MRTHSSFFEYSNIKKKVNEMYKEYIPFYLMYPLPLYYQEEEAYVRDYQYFTSIYGKLSKEYQRYIEDYLAQNIDKMQYIYDEFPDRILLEKTIEEIVNQMPKDREVIEQEKEFISVLLYHTIIFRRQNNRKFG